MWRETQTGILGILFPWAELPCGNGGALDLYSTVPVPQVWGHGQLPAKFRPTLPPGQERNRAEVFRGLLGRPGDSEVELLAASICEEVLRMVPVVPRDHGAAFGATTPDRGLGDGMGTVFRPVGRSFPGNEPSGRQFSCHGFRLLPMPPAA